MGTLSVSFSGNRTGDIKFVVTALDIRGCAIGVGAALISIIKGATNEGIVFLAPEESCTGDAGAPDLPPGSSFPGCDPTGLSCPAAQSCQLDCQARSNVCAAAGSSPAGGTCPGMTGCAPGSQCFDYSSLGCGTQLCLRFCATDGDCAAFGDGGVGPGSFCRDPVACGGVTTAYQHLLVQLRSDRGGGGRVAGPHRLPGRPRLRDPVQHGPRRLQLPRGDAHRKRERPLHQHRAVRAGVPVRADLPRRLPLRRAERRLHRAQRLPHHRHDLHRRPEPDDLRGLSVIARRSIANASGRRSG